MTNDSSTGGFIQPYSSPLFAEDDALDAIFQALVVGIVGLPTNLVRPRWQPVPPPQPEITVNWCSIGVLDEDTEVNIALQHFAAPAGPTSLGYTKASQNGILNVMASFYGPNKGANANMLRMGVMMGQNRESLIMTNIQLAESPGKYEQVPALINNQWVRKADLLLRFRRKSVRLYPIDDLHGAKITVNTDRATQDASVTAPPPD